MGSEKRAYLGSGGEDFRKLAQRHSMALARDYGQHRINQLLPRYHGREIRFSAGLKRHAAGRAELNYLSAGKE